MISPRWSARGERRARSSPTGRCQLRIGAADSASRRVGSVHYDLEIQAFASAPLTMSGVVLTSALASRVRTAATATGDDLNAVLPGPPAVSRAFQAGEELALVAEIYDNQTKTPHTVDIGTMLRSDDGRVVYANEEQRSSAELRGASGGYGYHTRIPLNGLTPGLYVLKVEARSRLGGGFAAVREVLFRVIP
jgi:hypothetical protein